MPTADIEQRIQKMHEAREKGLCPICGADAQDKGFKDALSEREFLISGLCQACQDSVFE